MQWLLLIFTFVIATIIATAVITTVLKSSWLRRKRETDSVKLKKSSKNPLLSPRASYHWESEAVFNPAAFKDDEGRIHLLYRAVGGSGISQIGHASSVDGINFDDRSAYPIYDPGINDEKARALFKSAHYDPIAYVSGGSSVGCEDPRVVQIDDRIYMTYTAFEGWNSVRIALTSILSKDFKNKKWNWKKPKMISPPGEVHKNWTLFPEKIKNKFAILHGISPTILIDYVDDLESFRESVYIRSRSPSGGREKCWDNRIRGGGPPPIKTPYGWLLLYHATDMKEPDKYKVGGMVLDLADPTKILFSSGEPLLTPDMPYENDGKPGVVYATGAVVKDDNLFVYYGGGDKHTCVATSPLQELLQYIMYGKIKSAFNPS